MVPFRIQAQPHLWYNNDIDNGTVDFPSLREANCTTRRGRKARKNQAASISYLQQTAQSTFQNNKLAHHHDDIPWLSPVSQLQTDTCPFLTLPLEIRNQIYDILFDKTEVHASYQERGVQVLHPLILIKPEVSKYVHESLSKFIRRCNQLLSITRVNSQIRNEALQQLWCKLSTIHFISFRGPQASSLTIPNCHLRRVKTILTDSDSTLTNTILRPNDFPDLKTLILMPYEATSHTRRVAGEESSRAKAAWEQFLCRCIEGEQRQRCIVDHFLSEERKYEAVFRHMWYSSSFDDSIGTSVVEQE